MIEERNVENFSSLEGRHGFILSFGVKLEKDSIQRGAKLLNKKLHDLKITGLAAKDIEFYFEPIENYYAFVYPENCSFCYGEFFEYSNNARVIMQINGCDLMVDALANFLKVIKNVEN
jgi:hypothetical protein